jgi:hypothetical protein
MALGIFGGVCVHVVFDPPLARSETCMRLLCTLRMSISMNYNRVYSANLLAGYDRPASCKYCHVNDQIS